MLDSPKRSPTTRVDEHGERSREVCCRACGAVVARVDDRVVIGAGDLHTFVNPQGHVFELICFAIAEGAVALGEATLEFTWFPGHAWRFAFCRACGAQLGWRYDGETGFWGLARAALILDRRQA